MLEGEVRDLLLVHLLHLLDDSEGNIDVCQVLVAILVHFLGQARVSAADVEDLEGRLNILGHDILDPGVALVPVKRLLIPMVIG